MWGSINCGPPLENTGIALQVTFVLLPPVCLAPLSFLSLRFSSHGTPSSNVSIAAGGGKELFTAARITAVSAGRGGQLARNFHLLSAWARQA